jgi:hypothetical protein
LQAHGMGAHSLCAEHRSVALHSLPLGRFASRVHPVP